MLSTEIEKIEFISSIKKNPHWYYHGITSPANRFPRIMQDGLLSKNLSGYARTKNGYNGKYYISLSKDIEAEVPLEDSAYSTYIDKYPMLIIEDINAFKCLKVNGNSLFTNTILPFRTSGYRDEYQAFNKIDRSKFRGIEAKAYDWSKKEKLSELRYLKDILLLMKEFGTYLPVFDFSREENGIIHEIDQDGYLLFSKKNL